MYKFTSTKPLLILYYTSTYPLLNFYQLSVNSYPAEHVI